MSVNANDTHLYLLLAYHSDEIGEGVENEKDLEYTFNRMDRFVLFCRMRRQFGPACREFRRSYPNRERAAGKRAGES
jgi:hypothetical protein